MLVSSKLAEEMTKKYREKEQLCSFCKSSIEMASASIIPSVQIK